jgi:hypothetical protein
MSEKLPDDGFVVHRSWLECDKSAQERTGASRLDHHRIRDLALAMQGCTQAEVLAAVEQATMAVFAKKLGGPVMLSAVALAAVDEDYVRELQELALPLKAVAYRDAWDALKARMLLANFALLYVVPDKPF